MKKYEILTGAIGISLIISSSISMSIYYGLRDMSIHTMDLFFSIPLTTGYILIIISAIVCFWDKLIKK